MTPACASCGAPFTPGARFCRECGSPAGDGGGTPTTVVEPKASGGVVGRNCPYCHFPLKEGAPVTGCEFCHAVHHADCWSDNGGCAVASCQGGPDGTGHPPLSPSVAPTAGRHTDKLHVDLGSAPPQAREPAWAPSGPAAWAPSGTERRGRGLWMALIVAVSVAILAGGATAAVLIVSKKDDEDTSASTPTTDPGGDTRANPPNSSGKGAESNPSDVSDLTASQIKQQIVDVVTKNIELVSSKDYQAAWEQTLSYEYRDWKESEKGYLDWEEGQQKNGFSLNPPVRVRVVDVKPSGEIDAVILSGISTQGDEDNPSLTCYCGYTWFRYQDGEMRWDPGYGSVPARERRWEGDCGNLGQPDTGGCTGRSYSS